MRFTCFIVICRHKRRPINVIGSSPWPSWMWWQRDVKKIEYLFVIDYQIQENLRKVKQMRVSTTDFATWEYIIVTISCRHKFTFRGLVFLLWKDLGEVVSTMHVWFQQNLVTWLFIGAISNILTEVIRRIVTGGFQSYHVAWPTDVSSSHQHRCYWRWYWLPAPTQNSYLTQLYLLSPGTADCDQLETWFTICSIIKIAP